MKYYAAVAMCSTMILSACGGSGGGSPTIDFADANVANFGPVAADVDVNSDMDFRDILNNLRGTRGLEGVTYDPRLDAAAEKYAVEQASLPVGVLSHTGQDGSTVYDRIVAEGYDPVGWAENLAKGHQSQAEVLQGWINSPGHNANLNAGLEDFALGVSGSGSSLSWVLILATERQN